MKDPDKTLTKVVWKINFQPKNAPVSKVISENYEVTCEFQCSEKDLGRLDDEYENSHASKPDSEEIIHSDEDTTQFSIKSKTVFCDYEELQKKLGYGPDAIEFDAHVKRLAKEYREKVFQKIKLPKAS